MILLGSFVLPYHIIVKLSHSKVAIMDININISNHSSNLPKTKKNMIKYFESIVTTKRKITMIRNEILLVDVHCRAHSWSVSNIALVIK